ncbi:MAG: hypothetical protein GXP25_22440 [Planctomycetes bacterium]|nr:hypothetical protein [Planctomycetota bacterium]
MPINVKCPYCEKTISARDELAGKSVDCPSCMTQLDIPEGPCVPDSMIPLDAVSAGEKPASYYIDACPHCGKVVSAPDQMRWSSGNCPSCKKPLGQPAQPKPQAKKPRQPTTGVRRRNQAPPPVSFVGGVF